MPCIMLNVVTKKPSMFLLRPFYACISSSSLLKRPTSKRAWIHGMLEKVHLDNARKKSFSLCAWGEYQAFFDVQIQPGPASIQKEPRNSFSGKKPIVPPSSGELVSSSCTSWRLVYIWIKGSGVHWWDWIILAIGYSCDPDNWPFYVLATCDIPKSFYMGNQLLFYQVGLHIRFCLERKREDHQHLFSNRESFVTKLSILLVMKLCDCWSFWTKISSIVEPLVSRWSFQGDSRRYLLHQEFQRRNRLCARYDEFVVNRRWKEKDSSGDVAHPTMRTMLLAVEILAWKVRKGQGASRCYCFQFPICDVNLSFHQFFGVLP